MSDVFAADASAAQILWTIAWQSTAWQSTAWLTAGLLLSRCLGARAARAHRILLISIVAALISPALTILAGAMEWGLLPPEPAVQLATVEAPKQPASGTISVPAFAAERPADPSRQLADAETLTRVIRAPAPMRPAQNQTPGERLSVSWNTAILVISLGAWASVSSLLAVRLARGVWSAVALVRAAEPAADAELSRQLNRSAHLMGVAAPRLLSSPDCRCPMIWCWGRRSTVIVPPGAAGQSTLAWQAIFCHELAHAKRRDHRSDLCGELLLIALPWQPLAWLARSWMSAYGEQACDDWSLSCGNDVVDYAETLLGLVPQGTTSFALAAVTSHATLAYRVRRLLVARPLSPAAGRVWSVAVSLATLAALCGVALAQQSGEAESIPAIPKVASTQALELQGSVVDDRGIAVAGAAVSVIVADKATPKPGGDFTPSPRTFWQTSSGPDGRFQLSLPELDPEKVASVSLTVYSQGYGVAWRDIDPLDPRLEESIQLAKEERIAGRLIDSDGQPAAGVLLRVRFLVKRPKSPEASGRGPSLYCPGDEFPVAWPPECVSDAQGYFTVSGISGDDGVSIDLRGNDRLAPQSLVLNTGMPETRGPRDGTYRPQNVRDLKPGEEPTFVLAPAQIIAGTVRYEDTGQPVAGGRLTVYSGESEFSSFSGIDGSLDDEGRYRMNANPGGHFKVTAYPPAGSPYLIRIRQFNWEGPEKAAQTDLALPRGVLVRGRVVDAGSERPIENATVQYVPQGAKKDYDLASIITGWQGIQTTDGDGEFAIAVLPGPGHLLVQAPSQEYVRQEISQEELYRGKVGGSRNYAHAIEPLDPAPNSETIELVLSLTPASTVTGLVLDDQGQPVKEAHLISRLSIPRHSTTWRGGYQPTTSGGRFKLGGCAPDVVYPVSFLDPEKKLGATVELGARDAGREVVVQLGPCGAATCRFVDSQGNPSVKFEPTVHMVVTPGPQSGSAAARYGIKPAADTDFISNIDRPNHDGWPVSDDEGKLTLEALIPGATYRLIALVDGRFVVLKEFTAETGHTLDLGEVTVPSSKQE